MGTTPRLVLHIGTEKTGTTSIQEFLRINIERYLSKGVFVPSFLGHSNHSLLPAIAYKDERNDDLSLAYALHDSQSRASRRRDTIALLQQSAQTYPQHTVVISSEHLQSRLTDPEELQRLHDLLAPIYSSIQILLYIRKPIDTAISSLSTGIKCGKTATRIPPPSDPYIQNLCMHRQTVERWATTFGLSNITVRLFSRQHFKDGDLLRDFAAASAIPFDDDLAIPPRTNEKLGFDGLRFLGLINEQVPYIAQDRFNPLRANLVSLFESHFCESPEYAPSQQEITSYADHYRESDEWIRLHFFAHLPALWPETGADRLSLSHPAKPAQPGLADNPEAYNPAEVRKLLRLFAEAWNEKQSQISQLRDQLAAAEAKRTTAGPTTTTPGTTTPTSTQPN
jgi:hypothetical protein